MTKTLHPIDIIRMKLNDTAFITIKNGIKLNHEDIATHTDIMMGRLIEKRFENLVFFEMCNV